MLPSPGHAPEVFNPAGVLGELFFGAAKSHRHAEDAAPVERFAPPDRSIVPCDLDVAREYDGLKQRLRQKGRPPVSWRVPTTDLVADMHQEEWLNTMSKLS